MGGIDRFFDWQANLEVTMEIKTQASVDVID
jgi:hypothetical protein